MNEGTNNENHSTGAGSPVSDCSARPRDATIDAATHALIRMIYPQITNAEIQQRGDMEIHAGAYTMKLDGEPICHVELDGSRRFILTILCKPNTKPHGHA